MIAGFLNASERVTVPCTLDIEMTAQSFHAYAVPEGITLRPGDTVIVHGAPDHVSFGECYTRDCTATVIRAGLAGRLLARLAGLVSLTELYEVGFDRESS